MKYFITYHAIERLKDRFPVLYNKHEVLKKWSKDKGTQCVKEVFDKLISESEENRSYLNNSMYMLKLYDKYGYDTEYQFLQHKNENILFILTKDRSEIEYRLITLMPTEFRPSVKNVKYNDKEKKIEKQNKSLMDWYDKVSPQITDAEEKEKKRLHNVLIKNELIFSLQTLVDNNKTTIKSQLNKSTSLHEVIFDMKRYEFYYKKENNLIKEITIEKVSDISKEEREQENIKLIKLKLVEMVLKNQTTILNKISNTKTIHEALIDDDKYEFIYKSPKEVIIEKIMELSQEEKDYKQLQSYITPELKEGLINMIHSNMSKSEKISNTRSLHMIDYNNFTYHILSQKSPKGKISIFLKEKPREIGNNRRNRI